MARPQKQNDEKRTRKITFMVSEAEDTEIRALAESNGFDQHSAFVRTAVLGEIPLDQGKTITSQPCQKEKTVVNISQRMPEDLHERVKAFATENGLSINGVINQACEYFLSSSDFPTLERRIAALEQWQEAVATWQPFSTSVEPKVAK